MDDAEIRPTGAHPTAAADELIIKHLPLVRAIAARLYRARWNASVEFNEYYQMGTLGLVEAAQRFDADRGVQFGSFATWRISGAILNGLTKSTEQHQQAASRRRQIESRVDSLAEDREDPVDDSMEAALARIADMAIGLAVGFMLDGTGMYGDEAVAETSHRLDGYASIAHREARHRVRTAVEALPAQERTVIERHYLQHHAFTNIADDMDLTRGRVSQIHKAGLHRLRGLLKRDNVGFEA